MVLIDREAFRRAPCQRHTPVEVLRQHAVHIAFVAANRPPRRAIPEGDVRSAIAVAYAEMQAADLKATDAHGWRILRQDSAPSDRPEASSLYQRTTRRLRTPSQLQQCPSGSRSRSSVCQVISPSSWCGISNVHLIGHVLNGRNLGPKPEHMVRVDDIMRQLWQKIGSDWKLKHWDDTSGTIWVDGHVQEHWTPDLHHAS